MYTKEGKHNLRYFAKMSLLLCLCFVSGMCINPKQVRAETTSGDLTPYKVQVDDKGKPVLDADGKQIPLYEKDADGNVVKDADGNPVLIDTSWTEDYYITDDSYTKDTIHIKGDITVSGQNGKVACIKNKTEKDDDGNYKPIFEVESGSTLTLEDIEIDGQNKESAASPCIVLDEGANLVIRKNTSIHSAKCGVIDYDISESLKPGDDIPLINNGYIEVSDDGTFQVTTDSSNTVEYTGNGGNGIFASKNSVVQIESCSIYNCEGSGIYANGATVDMRGGKIRDCGVGVSGADNATVLMISGEIYNCNKYGIFLDDDSTINFTDGKIHDNDNAGISVSNCDITISDTASVFDNAHGICLAGTSVCNFDGGIVSNNTSDGITMTIASTVNMTGGKLLDNTQNGIVANSGCIVNFSGGIISGSDSGIMLMGGSLDWTGGDIIESKNKDDIHSFSVYHAGNKCFISTSAYGGLKDDSKNSPNIYLDCKDGTDRYISTDVSRSFTIGSSDNSEGKLLVSTGSTSIAQGVCNKLDYTYTAPKKDDSANTAPEANYSQVVDGNNVVVGKIKADSGKANFNPGQPPKLGSRQVLITTKHVKKNANTGEYVLASTTIGDNHVNDDVEDIQYYVGQLKPHTETRTRTVTTYTEVSSSDLSSTWLMTKPYKLLFGGLTLEQFYQEQKDSHATDHMGESCTIDTNAYGNSDKQVAAGQYDPNCGILSSYVSAPAKDIVTATFPDGSSWAMTKDPVASDKAGTTVYVTNSYGNTRYVKEETHTETYTVTVWYCDPYTPDTISFEGYDYKDGAQTRYRISSNTTITVRYDPEKYTMKELHQKHVLYDDSYMKLDEKTHGVVTDTKCDKLKYVVTDEAYYDQLYKPSYQTNPKGWGWHNGSSTYESGARCVPYNDGWTTTGAETFNVYYEPNEYTVTLDTNKPYKRNYDGTFQNHAGDVGFTNTSVPVLDINGNDIHDANSLFTTSDITKAGLNTGATLTDSVPRGSKDTQTVTFTAYCPNFGKPTLTGYTFDGWFTSNALNVANNDYVPVVSGKNPHDLVNDQTTAYTGMSRFNDYVANNRNLNNSTVYNLISDSTLYAQWTPITYKLYFDDNSPYHETQLGYYNPTVLNDTAMPAVTLTYDQPFVLPENLYDRTTLARMEYNGGDDITKHSSFLGWGEHRDEIDYNAPNIFNIIVENKSDGSEFKSGYKVNNEKVVSPDKGSVVNLTATKNGSYTLYAIWDDNPDFIFEEFPDRYFTLDDAKAGMITESELLSQVVAYDRESHPLVTKTSEQIIADGGSRVGITLVDYSAEDFTSLEDSTSTTVTYRLEDDYGHVGYMTCVVRVSYNDIERHMHGTDYVRGITDYYSTQSEADGGFSNNSLWLTEDDYKDTLNNTFQSGNEVYKHTFSSQDFSDIRDYINENGFGNSENSDALKNLYNQYQ